MSAWNSVIFLKTNKSWSDLSAVAKWDGVERMWSTTGDWDWCIKLNEKNSSPEQTETFVSRVRDGHWASETKTNWWKEVATK